MYICMVQRTDHPVRLYAFSSAENACDKAMQTAMECRDQAKPGYYEPGKGKIVFHGYGEEPDLFIVSVRWVDYGIDMAEPLSTYLLRYLIKEKFIAVIKEIKND